MKITTDTHDQDLVLQGGAKGEERRGEGMRKGMK